MIVLSLGTWILNVKLDVEGAGHVYSTHVFDCAPLYTPYVNVSLRSAIRESLTKTFLKSVVISYIYYYIYYNLENIFIKYY